MLLQSITCVTQLYTAAAAALGFLFVIGFKIIIHRGEKKKKPNNLDVTIIIINRLIPRECPLRFK